MPQFRSMQSSGNNAKELVKKEHRGGGLLSKYSSGGLAEKSSRGGLPGKSSGRLAERSPHGGLLSKYSHSGLPDRKIVDAQVVSMADAILDQGHRRDNTFIERETERQHIISSANVNRSLQVQVQNQYMPLVPVQRPFVRHIPLRNIIPSSAMERMPLVIPGRKARLPQTDALPRQRMHPMMRQGILTVSMVGIFLFCMITLTPLSDTHANVLSQWVSVSTNSLSMANNEEAPGSSSPGDGPGTLTDGPVGTTDYYISLARQDAVKWGIPPDYYQRQIQQESHFDPYAESGVGAIGIAQFMPSTAAEYGINPYDPVQALDGGAHMMSDLNNEFNGNYAMALAAYNAGPGAVDDAIAACGNAWLSCMDGQPQAYVEIIMYGASY